MMAEEIVGAATTKGRLVFVAPDTKHVYATSAGRREPDQIIGKLIEDAQGRHLVHIGFDKFPFSDDPRIVDGRLPDDLKAAKGIYMILKSPAYPPPS